MSRALKSHSFVFAAVAAALFAVSASAATAIVSVSGLADIWLAGQPNGTVLKGPFPGQDVAPTNSPVLATGVNLVAGTTLTFSATGTTDYGGCTSPSPDGGGACGNLNFVGSNAGPFFGISTFNGPINALVGVFLNASTPGGTAPTGLDFSTPSELSQPTISPQLNQVFFIGDGLTGTGTGAVQQVVIPAGATRLYLASSDGAGANYNNGGSFNVTVTDSGTTPPTVPLPSTGLLTLLGLAAAAAFFKASPRFRRPA